MVTLSYPSRVTGGKSIPSWTRAGLEMDLGRASVRFGNIS